jgi:hypothetical protein
MACWLTCSGVHGVLAAAAGGRAHGSIVVVVYHVMNAPIMVMAVSV